MKGRQIHLPLRFHSRLLQPSNDYLNRQDSRRRHILVRDSTRHHALPDVVSLSTPPLLNLTEFSDSLIRDRFARFPEYPYLSVARVDAFRLLLLLIGQR